MNVRQHFSFTEALPQGDLPSELAASAPVPQPRTSSHTKSSTSSKRTTDDSELRATSTRTSGKAPETVSKCYWKKAREGTPVKISNKISQKTSEKTSGRTPEDTAARQNLRLLSAAPTSRAFSSYSNQAEDKSEGVCPTHQKKSRLSWSWPVQNVTSRRPTTSSKGKSGVSIATDTEQTDTEQTDTADQMAWSTQRTSKSSSHATDVRGAESGDTKTFIESADVAETPILASPSSSERVQVRGHQESWSAVYPGRQKKKIEVDDEVLQCLNEKRRPPSGATATPGIREQRANITTGTRTLDTRGDLPVLNRELCLYPLAFLALLVTAAVLVMVLRPRQQVSSLHGSQLALKTCTSLHCIQDAAYLDHLLAWNVKPCDNFYMFVCSRWTSRFPASGRDHTTSADDDYVTELEGRIYSMLANRDQKLDKGLLTAQGLVEQCVTANRTGEESWSPLLELLSSLSLEGFPLTPPVRKGVSVWKMAARLLRKTGVAAFFGVSVSSHPYTSKDIASLEMPGALSSIEGVSIRQVIETYTTAAFVSAKVLKKEFIPSVHKLNVVRFASELEKLFQLHSGDRSFKIGKLGDISSADEFLREVFVGVPEPVFNQDSEVYIQSPDFVSNMVGLVQKTALHNVMNFLGVRMMIQISPFLPQPDLLDVQSSILYNAPRTSVPRWRLCVRVVEKALPSLLLRSSLADIDLHGSAASFTDLVSEMTQEFVRGTDAAAFLSAASKTAIRSIINDTNFKVLSSSWIQDNKLFNEYVRGIPPLTSNGLDSYVAAHEHSFMTGLARGSSERWSRSAFSTDCWSELGPRTIYIPMLVFNVSLAFAADINTFQLARAGVRVGRCIFSMLLSEAASAAPSGQWLDEDARSKVVALQRCIGEPEDPYRMTRVRDAWVAHYVYRHFEKATGGKHNSLRLRLAPNADAVAPSQLFFIYLVLQSCQEQAEPDKYAFANGVPWNAALRHERAFHEAFRCAAGSPMNPGAQCDIF